MSVTNDTLAAVRKPKIGVQSEECVEFDFNGLRDQPPRARAQDFRKRILSFMAQRSLLEVRVVWLPTPLRRLLHPVTQIFSV